MTNLFDRSNYPTQEPETLAVGDRWTWRRPDLVQEYPPADYALTYEFHHDKGGGHQFNITATETSDDYVIEVPSATTANYHAHEYKWMAYITRTSDSERITIDSGYSRVVHDFTDTTKDVRSHAKIVLDKIEAVIEGRATRKEASYSIAGRSLSLTPVSELLQLRATYRALYKNEIYKARVKNGQPTGKTIKAKF